MHKLFLILLLFTSCSTFKLDLFNEWEYYTNGIIKIYYRKNNFSKSLSPNIEFIEGVALEQLNAVIKAESILGKKVNYIINVYLYNQDEAMVSSNPHGGRAILQSNKIIQSYDASTTFTKFGEKYFIGTHEIAHIIFGNEFGNSTISYNRLLTEGIAVWFDDGYQKIGIRSPIYNAKFTYKKPLDHWMVQYAGNLPSLIEIINNQNEMKEALFYPIAGMFIKYLYSTYGINVINALYQESKESFEYSITKLLKKHLSEIDYEFNSYINNYIKNVKVEYIQK